ncbi:VpsF family polysaccharide biosynthesis protein [Shewanella gaetbuli]|uniref:VpsF family polysaccharide biosynthesis protein n=1 Tax=Shewanella gaetbuli TaxID=220752 RepID=A0A9X1ZNQ7_9GAMM|nr:VpsF family polysaccharide biosynthesis protein [Shewanella gaetbuli]MCL1143250.1 VpsF family polysaccharide biosynthesis protein [Shewanella gaetbuli]
MPRITFFLFFTATLSFFVLSSDVLSLFGYNFLLEGGYSLYKLHPSFYILFFSVLSLFLYRGGPLLLSTLLIRYNFHFLFLLLFLCFFYQVFLLKQPMATTLITWFTPLLILMMFFSLTSEQQVYINKILLNLITFNAFIGLFEYVIGSGIVPKNYYDLEQGAFVDVSEWGFERSSSLYGHPLIASFVSAVVVVGLFSKNLHFKLSISEKVCLSLSLLSLPAFGGRFSILISIFVLLVLFFIWFYYFISGAEVFRVKIILGMVFIAMFPFLILFLFNLGLFDLLILRVTDDNGSAESRLTALYILFDTPLKELLFGDLNSDLYFRQLLYGTKYGVELSWVASILQSGLLVTLIFIFVLYCVVKVLYIYIGPHTFFSSFAFLLISFSGTGLSSKTLMLSQFVLISIFILNVKNESFVRA